jgi:hypothetical protein
MEVYKYFQKNTANLDARIWLASRILQEEIFDDERRLELKVMSFRLHIKLSKRKQTTIFLTAELQI